MKTAVFSVVYPGVDCYLAQLLASVSLQKDQNFTLYLVNDGLQLIESFLGQYEGEVKVRNAKGSPAQLRKLGIEWLFEDGVEAVVFVDADDYMPPNRMQVVKRCFEKVDVVVNELILFGDAYSIELPMIGRTFNDGDEICASHVKSFNCCGLTNTAARVEVLEGIFNLIPNETIAFDWALFALCLNRGARALYTNETFTYYRQYVANTASVQKLSEKQVMQGVLVKQQHYQILAAHYENYHVLCDRFTQWSGQLEQDHYLRQRYVDEIQKQPINGLWWQSIKLPEELGL